MDGRVCTPKPGYRLISWLLSTSIFATACAVALTLATEKMLQGHLLPSLSPLHLLVAGCTLAEYNVHHLLNAEKPAEGSPSLYSHWWHPGLCFTGLLLCAIALPSLNHRLLLWLAVLGVAALLYSAPHIVLCPKRRINDYGITKIMVLTLTWVAVTTVFPALYLHLPWNAGRSELVVRTLLIFPLCLAFDQRDVGKDRAAGIRTLAVALGMRRSFILMYSVLWLLAVCGCYAHFVPLSGIYRPAVAAAAAILASAAIACSRYRPHPFVYSGLIDGAMLVYGLLIVFT